MADPLRDVRLTRRALLKISALTGGGLALGVCFPAAADPLVASPDPKQTAADAAPPLDPSTELTPNAWIHIHGDGRIRLILARSEMGQGVMTALPMLIAEELEVGLAQVEVEVAQADPVFANSLLGEQATGGGTSVRDAWLGLREAGAAARRLLVKAAADTWGAPESACRAHHGQVNHPDGSRSLTYAELAAVAARLPLPAPGPLKAASEWTLIGTPQPRLDTPGKVAGTAIFGLDVRVPGMLFATIERCQVLGSRVKGWRGEEAARRVPGVVAVLAVRRGVAVVAKTTWAALRGREAIELDCRPATNGAADSERLRARFRTALNGRATMARQQGDVSPALDSAAHQIEAIYEVPFQAHACMEPMNCVADVGPDYCRIHVPTQAQGGVLEVARRLTGLPASRIEVHTTLLGGGFGRRREQDFVADAVELSMSLRRPVQVVWTRSDDLQHDFYRPMTLHRLRAGLDANGRPVAWFHRIVGPSVLARVKPSSMVEGIDATLLEGTADLPYAFPHLRVEYRRADTLVPVGDWQGGGYSQNAFVTECFLDELARAAKKDPLALRRELLFNAPRHLKVLELAAERSGWGQPLADGHAHGIALVAAFGSLIAQVAEVSVSDGGLRVHRVVCALDCGQVVNPDTVRALVQGGVVYGLTACLKGAITLADGRVEQRNFSDFQLLRCDEAPQIEVHLVPSTAAPGGVSGLGTAPIAPAVANAALAVTGQPVRALPIRIV
jgi:isoquinoline 1-oxidoreductase subunit beta